jgi:hypothetical protein
MGQRVVGYVQVPQPLEEDKPTSEVLRIRVIVYRSTVRGVSS